MDHRVWERPPSRSDDPETWESNSSDEESSMGEFDGTDLTMHATDADLEEELPYEFPRDHLSQVLEGLNKWPWTVYPTQLSQCLASAAKIVHVGVEESSLELRRLQTLYREAVPSAFEKCLDDKAIWKWADDIHANILDAVCRLMDLVVAKLPQLIQDDLNSAVDEDLVPLLRALAIGFDKHSQFHVKHKEQTALPPFALSYPHKFAKPVPGAPVKQKNGDWYCSARKASVREADGCPCSRCQPPDVHCWLAYLVNYFGFTNYGSGYQSLLRVLNQPQKLMPAVIEVLLLPIAKAVEFLIDDVAQAFVDPCTRLLQYVSDLLEKDVDALSDNTRDGSFGALSSILKHLQAIIGRSLSAEKAESMVSVVQRRMVERMLGFPSFNKQLSAVREINKLLENARFIASRDNSRSVFTTIQWLEENDILRHILRSHLHHKQYVDQVEKIMRYLLQERRLSEEHLDAIWAATEKPDQFETVKANIFDLLADLAWSFSDEQLDSLFGRFERSQGRPAADIVKILSLVKKLARSDTKGVMASRLLELLWNMMHSGEAPAEILESGALTEILGHYDSVSCASKDVYISRCLKNIENGESVIPSLRLLREIILLDNEKPFYTGEVSRQMRLQELIKNEALTQTVVSSLEVYMARACSAPSGTANGSKSSERDKQYSHKEHVQERLDFLLFSLQSAGASLPWELTERVWNCLVESPAGKLDEEMFMKWLSDALEVISPEARASVLTEKITSIHPASLTPTAYRCFTGLFLWVNVNEKKLKQLRGDDNYITEDLDLVGLPYLWDVALCSSVDVIVDQSIIMLRDVHTWLSESLQQEVVAIRQSFIDECMRHLISALRNDGVKNQVESAESSILASCSMAEGILNGGVKVDNGEERPFVDPNKGGSNDHLLASLDVAVGEVHQVERCLRLLRLFILRCEGRCPRKMPAHGASFQGRPLLLGITTASKQGTPTRFDLWVHANEYLGSLRAKVAKRLECPSQRVRLTCLNKELVEDAQVLQQCGLVDGYPISAAVNIVERAVEAMDEQELPGVLISKKIEIYDILFQLADASNSRVREGANLLLSLLPTHPALLADFENLHKKSPEIARKQLSAHFGARSRLLYTLQVLDGILMPVNRIQETHTSRFRLDFLRFGGFQHLLAVFESGALPEGIDERTRRGCYASGLRILKYLLLNKHGEEIFDVSPPDVTRADGSVVTDDGEVSEEEAGCMIGISSKQAEDGKSNGSKNLDGVLEIVDMSAVVQALKRLTWSAGLGHISAMGSSLSFSASLRKLERRADWKKTPAQVEGTELDSEDEYLCTEALSLLVSCLLMHRELLAPFFSSSETGRFIVDMVLYPPNERVRLRSAVTFLDLSKISTDNSDKQPVAHQYILAALIGAKGEANKQPRRCLHYWELLGQLLSRLKGAEDTEMAENQLVEELTWLKSAPVAIDEDDRLLEGHLTLIKILVEVLDNRRVSSTRALQGGLVHEIIRYFLFRESALLWGKSEDLEAVSGAMHFDGNGGSPQDDSMFQSKCSTRRSRDKAFQLLIFLATHSLDNLREVVDLLVKIHFSSEIPEWEHIPSYGRKAVGGYVGLKNAGATCYMNSVFQQLYMQPEVRRTVLACSECDDSEKPDSVFFQLQAMFGALLGSNLDHYTPQGFWCAYRDYDGLPINLREHQDAFEFFNRLYDTVDETLKATQQETTLTKIFGGVFVQQVICRGCPHKSERQEPFAAISVDVKNKRDLLESLESFVRGDLLEADNAYYCEECGVKVDALKRVCVKLLPHTLVVHLKRFDFDYESMQRLKLKDRFEFPVHLDMKPFTVEGLASRDVQNHVTGSQCNENGNSCAEGSITQEGCVKQVSVTHAAPKPDSYYNYELVGVVVHSGTAFAGHYYSYIKERPGDCPLNAAGDQSGRWIAFDDKRVEPYNINDLEKDCFGGKYMVDVYDNFLKTTAPQEFDRPNSAYMLLYERCHSGQGNSIDSPAGTATSKCKEEDDGDESMKETGASERPPLTLTSVQMPASIHRSVWEENLRFVHENHLLDKDYFRFLHTLVEVEIGILDERLFRKSQATVEDNLKCARGMGETTGRRVDGLLPDVQINEYARLTTQLATEFLLRVYLRTHSSLREDLPQWKSTMWRLLEANIHACRYFVLALVDRPYWLHQYLLKCPVDEIRQSFAAMLVRAMQCAVSFLRGSSYLRDGNGRQADALFVDALIEVLLSLLRDAIVPKCYLAQYFGVVLEYAKIGTSQRQHLLQKCVVSHLAGFASKVNYSALKVDLSCLHSTVSLLVRSCDVSKMCGLYTQLEKLVLSFNIVENFDPDKENMICDGADELESKVVGPPSPLQLAPVLPLPSDAVEVIFKNHPYINVLIESCCEQEDVLRLLEFCCWQNETFSVTILQDILEVLHRAGTTEVSHLLSLILRLLQLKDSLQTVRQEIMLLGFHDFPQGVIDLIVVKAVNPHKRYALVKFVVKLVGSCPAARQYLLGRRVDWKRAVDWLNEELMANSPGPLSVPPISNEDLSNGYLQRTNTADWTLSSARELLSTLQ